MANTLDGYYGRMLSFLTQINIKNDVALCEAVIDSLRTMSSTWREVQARADAEARSTLTGHTGGDTGSGTISA